MALLGIGMEVADVVFAASNDERLRIAILDFKSEGAKSSLAQFAVTSLSEKLYSSGKFILVERSQLELILKEQGLQHAGCVDTSCAVRLGRILSVNKMLMGTVNRLDAYNLSVKSIDVETGVVDALFSAKATKETDLDKAVGVVSRKIYERYYGGGPTSAGYYLRGAVPGWAQVYSGHEVKGYTLLGAFVFSGIFMGYALYDFTNKRAEYEDLGKGTSQEEFDRKYDASEKALLTARISVGIFAAVYVLHVFDMLLFSRPTVVLGTLMEPTNIGSDMSLSVSWKRDMLFCETNDIFLFSLNKRELLKTYMM